MGVDYFKEMDLIEQKDENRRNLQLGTGSIANFLLKAYTWKCPSITMRWQYALLCSDLSSLYPMFTKLFAMNTYYVIQQGLTIYICKVVANHAMHSKF